MPHPFDLPPFDGRMPAGTEMRVSGTSGSPTRAIHVGETVAVLIAGNVSDVQHPEKVDGDGFASIVRKHIVKADRVYLLDREEGDGLLELEKRRAIELRGADEALQTSLPGMSAAVDADSLRELDLYAERLDRQADRMRDLGSDLAGRADEIRVRVAEMRAKLAELDTDEDDEDETDG